MSTFKARAGSAWEASFQCVSSVPPTLHLFQQTAPSNHGLFKPDVLVSIQCYGTLAVWKSTFVWCEARLGGVRVAFVNIVVHDSIDIPAQKSGTFCYAWTVLQDLQGNKMSKDVGMACQKVCKQGKDDIK